MQTEPIWNMLAHISVGDLVAWILVILAIISAIAAGTVKLYKTFERYKKIKDENNEQSRLIEKHEEVLKDINTSLASISNSLEEQKEVNLKQIRHTIVHTCEEALEKEEISINKLRSLEEMYQEYVDVFHGNGYVKTLVERVREIHIVGRTEN